MTAARLVRSRTPAPIRGWWRGKSSGERRAVTVLMLAVAIALLWIGIWEPLQRDVRRLRMEAKDTRAALTQARADVDEITRLAREPLPPPMELRPAVESALARSGLRNGLTDAQWQQGRGRITFAAVDFPSLMQWLDALHREAGVVVVNATVSARVDPGSVRAEVVLGR